MPAPKSPNTSAATEASVAARRRAKHERMARELGAAGWLVVPPEDRELFIATRLREAGWTVTSPDLAEGEILTARMLLRGEKGYLVLSREEVEEMLAKPIHKEGISAGWLRGYLDIPTPD